MDEKQLKNDIKLAVKELDIALKPAEKIISSIKGFKQGLQKSTLKKGEDFEYALEGVLFDYGNLSNSIYKTEAPLIVDSVADALGCFEEFSEERF